MADKAKADKKERGPVKYLALAEVTPGRWAIMGDPGREATSVYTLRREVRAELDAAAAATGTLAGSHRLIIVPLDQAHIVEASVEMEVRETFTKATLDPGPDPATLAGLVAPPQAETEADVAARMAAGTPPEGAIVGAPDVVAEPGAAAAHAAVVAEGAARAAQVPPVDPDDDDGPNPDIDPLTGVSRRTAAEARPEDEANTVFPIDGDV
jgi:hypothetical protein